MLKKLLIIAFIFLLGLNFNTIKEYLKKDFTHAMHVEYCQFYQGHIQACPYYTSDIEVK